MTTEKRSQPAIVDTSLSSHSEGRTTGSSSSVNGKHIKRIGVLLCVQEVNQAAFRFLVLCMNSQQTSFEFEFLPLPTKDGFLTPLWTTDRLDRQKVREDIPAFCQRYRTYLDRQVQGYVLKEEPPDQFALITMAKFTDNWYITRRNGLSVIALGNWQRWMAPPSLIEFVLTLLIREGVASVCPVLSGSVHLGTKGCPFDFTPSLSEVRQKVLNGYLCGFCRSALEAQGLHVLSTEIETVLRKGWLGRENEHYSPAGIASNLGYDLFFAKGLKATTWEALKSSIRQESIRQLIAVIGTVVGGVLLAVLIVILGLKQ